MITASTITRELLTLFNHPAYHSQQRQNTSDTLEFAFNRSPNDVPGEASLIYREQDDSEPTVTVSATPDIGAGIDVSITGPISDWMIRQRVDDGNLLTELTYNSQPVLTIYGPPATTELHTIKIRQGSSESILIPDEYRD